MKENKISVVIDKSIEEVFEFTTNPKNTPLWIEHIKEEVSDEYPPKIGTSYRNRGDSEWDSYKVSEFEKNKVFTLTDGNYSVRYSYRQLDENKTEMEYFEWIEEGELSNPFTEDILQNLKKVMER